ncbi:MAG: CPBP family intramembrane metalloprotease [Candidatus Riflebacteria bacterium]|nr:CPBP family intramembrane metalloprotease [Candidatus Riflebacteria bacterium]
MSRPVAVARATWLLTKLHLCRFFRRFSLWSGRTRPGVREATARKEPVGLVALVFLVLVVMAQGLIFGGFLFDLLSSGLGHPAAIRTGAVADPATAPPLPDGTSLELPRITGGSRLPGGALRGGGVLILLALMLFLSGQFRVHKLEESDWDLEWLSTLPLPARGIQICRVTHRALTSLPSQLLLLPFIMVMAWKLGFRWSAPVVSILVALPLGIIVAALHGALETMLRLGLGREARGSILNGLMLWDLTITGFMLYLCHLLAHEPGHPILATVRALPEWTLFTPPGLVGVVLASPTTPGLILATTLLWLEAVLCLRVSVDLMELLLRRGVVEGTGRTGGVRSSTAGQGPGIPPAPSPRRWLTPFQAKLGASLVGARSGWLLLLVASAVGLVIFGFTAFGAVLLAGIMPGGPGSVAKLAQSLCASPRAVGAVAFSLPAFYCLGGAMNAMAQEGPSIWLLYTVPRRLEELVAQAWCLIGGLLSVGIAALFGAAHLVALPVSLESTISLVCSLVAILAFSFTAICLGLLDCDPHAELIQARVNPTSRSLCLLLFYTYVAAILAGQAWQLMATTLFLVLVAAATWQRTVDYAPFVLDPVANPPPRVSMSHGMIASQVFISIQAVVTAIASSAAVNPVQGLFIAFVIAGGLTWAGSKFVFWRGGMQDAPRVFGGDVRQALGVGIHTGLLAAALGLVVVGLVLGSRMAGDQLLVAVNDPLARALGLAVAVIAAPLFEEFLFRGLLFGGVRRSHGFWTATTVSSLAFMICHPPMSYLPVFALGVCAAIARERTGRLLAPMIAHALYNALVLGVQMVP